jgi:energy-converting hydrogenase Eha subunit A
MHSFSLISIASWLAFCILVFCQQTQVRRFRGSSQLYLLALNLSVLLGLITGLGYIVRYAWIVAWWTPLIILPVGLLGATLGVIFERIVGTFILCLVAFAGWPVFAWFMFCTIPVVHSS